MEGAALAGNTVHLHLSWRVEVFLTPTGTYEAQLTGEGYQHRGTGDTPREAIIDAMDRIGQ